MHLSVRGLTHSDIPLIVDYWLNSDPDFLIGMGVALDKMPTEKEWTAMLMTQLDTPLLLKKSFALIWLIDSIPSGHCNINKIVPGKEAYMHLHLWHGQNRVKGMGSELVKLSLPHFFESYQLKKIYSEPYALNPAPNKALTRVGFRLVKEFITTPGILNFEQRVNLWEFSKEQLDITDVGALR